MRVWIDLANAPHVRFFDPIAEALRERGHEVLVTVRDHRETAILARERWPDAWVDGGSSPDGRVGKGVALTRRIAGLTRWARDARPDVALSHNSYAQIVAARLARMPAVTSMDYEHQPANHLAFRLAHRVVVPESFPDAALRRFGARSKRVRRYPGVKEELYLTCAPTPLDRVTLGVPPNAPFVALRLPPEGALYHRGGNDLLEVVVQTLRAQDAFLAVLGRTETQREEWRRRGDVGVEVLDPPVDTPALLAACDLFVGAGGTMTREAAVSGTPVCSIFAGASAAVDRWLAQNGRLTLVGTVEQAASLRVGAGAEHRSPLTGGGPMQALLAAVEEA
jgi:uncharacterized protein